MPIFFRGLGILVPVVFGACFYAVIAGCEQLYGKGYFENSYYPKWIALIFACSSLWFIGRYLNKNKTQVLKDEATGKTVVIRNTHDFFFVPFQYWGIMIGIAIGGVLISLLFKKPI